jgi:hypothetical protein
VPVPISSTPRFAGALLLPLRWAFVLLAVLAYIVLVPIIELAAELAEAVRRAFRLR